jgi:hypothetical protein
VGRLVAYLFPTLKALVVVILAIMSSCIEMRYNHGLLLKSHFGLELTYTKPVH